jgi:hypothetical protein
MRHLISWGTNSDARGWYPLLERRHERSDTFGEVQWIADELMHVILDGDKPCAGAYLVHPGSSMTWRDEVIAQEPLAFLTPEGLDAVEMVRRKGAEWEHHLRLDRPRYSTVSLERRRLPRHPAQPETGNEVEANGATLSFEDGILAFTPLAGPSVQIALPSFQICVKHLDEELRAPRPESDWRVSSLPGSCPRLVVERQLDYHIHFRAEYILDGNQVFADWRFWFTAPTLVDSLDNESTWKKPDFTPGGLRAQVSAGLPGAAFYDVPFGMVRHPNPAASFVAPLTHALLETTDGGVALVTQSGSQSFELAAADGSIALCMGKSLTSGGRRKLSFRIGDSITDFQHDVEWYKEFFYGELRHRFVVLPFAGDWRAQALPNTCRALATGPRWLESSALAPGRTTLAAVGPNNIHLAGVDPEKRKAILVEFCGLATEYHLELDGKEYIGSLGPFGIAEVEL